MEELQRQGQEELTNLELPPSSKFEYEEIYVDQSAPKIRAKNYSIDAI